MAGGSAVVRENQARGLRAEPPEPQAVSPAAPRRATRPRPAAATATTPGSPVRPAATRVDAEPPPAARRVDRTAVGENALEADQPTGPQQAQRFSEDIQRFEPVAVHEDQVVPTVGKPRQYVQRPPRNEPRPVPREPGRPERLTGEALPLRFGIDRGQDAVAAHALQQIDPGDTRPRADLRHGLGTRRRGQQPQRGAGTRRHRGQP